MEMPKRTDRRFLGEEVKVDSIKFLPPTRRWWWWITMRDSGADC